jgi:hypothetical protein
MELVFRVMCRPASAAPSLDSEHSRVFSLVGLNECIWLLAQSKDLQAAAVAGSGTHSARLLRRTSSLLVSGMKAALKLWQDTPQPSPGIYRDLTGNIGEGHALPAAQHNYMPHRHTLPLL